MSGNSRFHSKFHRRTHHTDATPGYPDSGSDPIASPDSPFQGDFVLAGELSASSAHFITNVVIDGDLSVTGTTTTLSSANTSVLDNYITLNVGESGAGVSLGSSGLIIDRGSESDFVIYFDEGDDVLKAGLSGSGQPVALREDTPINAGHALWSGSGQRFITISDQALSFHLSAYLADINVENTVRDLSSSWAGTYSTVASNSATWGLNGSDVSTLSSNWEGTWTTVNTNSAAWDAKISFDTGDTRYVNVTGDTVTGDLTITGNLTVAGSAFTVLSQTVCAEDNLIVINSGEAGAGVTSVSAGIQIDRGSEVPYNFIFNETSDTFRIGEDGSEQAVATREDAPLDTGIAEWDNSAGQFITTSKTLLATQLSAKLDEQFLKASEVDLTQGNSAFTTVNANSAYWDATYTTVNTNSAAWGFGTGSDVTGLSSNWQSTWTTVNANSGSWQGGVSGATFSEGGKTNIVAREDGLLAGGGRGDFSVDIQTARTSAASVASAPYSVIGGGVDNNISLSATYATIAGGRINLVTEAYGFVGGGNRNQVKGLFAATIGGNQNIASGSSSLAAGYANTAISGRSVSFGSFNHNSAEQSSILGGGTNTITSGGAGGYGYSAIVAGFTNTASGDSCIIGAGDNQTVTGDYSGILAGFQNTVAGNRSGILAGAFGNISGDRSAAINGSYNAISGADSASIGTGNRVGGDRSVAIGDTNVANGNNNVVIGRNSSSVRDDTVMLTGRSTTATSSGALFISFIEGIHIRGLVSDTPGIPATQNVVLWHNYDNSGVDKLQARFSNGVDIILGSSVLSANWSSSTAADLISVYTTVNANSAAWNTGGSGSDVSTLSSNWQSTWTTVNANSASWAGGGSDVSTLSSNWENTWTTVNANSAQWAIDTGSDVSTISGNWQSTWTTVNVNSASWAGGGSDVTTLSSNWQSTWTTVNVNSADWDSTHTTVNANSAQWAINTGSDVSTLSSNWEGTWTTVNTNSAGWESVESTVSTQSATWAGGGDVYNITYSSSIGSPQLFNPTVSGAANDTDDFTLSSSYTVAIVTLNGQVLDDSEYSQSTNILTVTPDVGFDDVNDEILVFQNSFPSADNGLVLGVVRITSDYTVNISNFTMLVSSISAASTLTLPPVSAASGNIFNIKRIDSSVYNTIIDGYSTETIDGSTSFTLTNQYDSITIHCDGIEWWVI